MLFLYVLFVIFHFLARLFFIFGFPFNLPRNTPEHLNVTTLRASSVRSFPVCGFLPFLGFFSIALNLPKPLMRTSFPDSRVDLMVSITVSVAWMDSRLERAVVVWIWFMRSDLVMVIVLVPCNLITDIRPVNRRASSGASASFRA